MCLYGIYKYVTIINPNQNKKQVVVDACIADEVQELNNKGIITLGCCCGHGQAGEIFEYENANGKWKEYGEPPHVLINEKSIKLSMELGYRPIPYYYTEGENYDVWKMYLKTGCITEEDCEKWHIKNSLPFKKNIGIIT
ncbi:hypothetical protein M3685_02155 [Heyndrickxia oleronia]|uniref:hypothetical protein n=1 Tax=Heyndrickxia oleronia TaxID=38875 RepID=UPI002040A1C4|nr:hypothetical protein [Heyndrickxia oleronia]MCM3452750.1 hypothetical protein [Heyndrickxia oleronia]